MENEPLIFIKSPPIVIATNTFHCRIPIRYKDTPVVEIIKEQTTLNTEAYTTKIPIFHSDGTKLAVVKGRQLYPTKDGEKAGVKMRHLADGTVCEINGKPAFEIRRKGAAALKMSAELHTFDGAFLRWSEEELSGQFHVGPDRIRIGSGFVRGCVFTGVVGIQIGIPTTILPTCLVAPLIPEDSSGSEGQ